MSFEHCTRCGTVLVWAHGQLTCPRRGGGTVAGATKDLAASARRDATVRAPAPGSLGAQQARATRPPTRTTTSPTGGHTP